MVQQESQALTPPPKQALFHPGQVPPPLLYTLFPHPQRPGLRRVTSLREELLADRFLDL